MHGQYLSDQQELLEPRTPNMASKQAQLLHEDPCKASTRAEVWASTTLGEWSVILLARLRHGDNWRRKRLGRTRTEKRPGDSTDEAELGLLGSLGLGGLHRHRGYKEL